MLLTVITIIRNILSNVENFSFFDYFPSRNEIWFNYAGKTFSIVISQITED